MDKDIYKPSDFAWDRIVLKILGNLGFKRVRPSVVECLFTEALMGGCSESSLKAALSLENNAMPMLISFLEAKLSPPQVYALAIRTAYDPIDKGFSIYGTFRGNEVFRVPARLITEEGWLLVEGPSLLRPYLKSFDIWCKANGRNSEGLV